MMFPAMQLNGPGLIPINTRFLETLSLAICTSDSVLFSFSQDKVSTISLYTVTTTGSVKSPLAFAWATDSRASSKWPLFTSHLGLSGTKGKIKIHNTEKIPWKRLGALHAHVECHLPVPSVMPAAIKAPTLYSLSTL